MRLSYKRCRKPIAPVVINFTTLTGMLTFIQEKLEEGYKLFSLDEAGFGGKFLQNYCWVERGKEVQPIFQRQNNLTLLAAISPNGVEAFQFISGGNNQEWFRNFLEEFLLNQKRQSGALQNDQLDQKFVILLDNASCHKTLAIRSWAYFNNVVLLFNIPYYARANPVELFFGDLKRRCGGVCTKNHQELAELITLKINTIPKTNFRSYFTKSFKSCRETLEELINNQEKELKASGQVSMVL